MTAIFYVGDAIEVMSKLPEKSVDLVISSPPFLALRSYLPADHPDKPLEGGSQSTPGEYVDWLLDVVEACARVLAPHGSLCFELGDTYSGSGGAGGDYAADGLREGQPTFKANPGRVDRYQKEGYPKSISSRPVLDQLPKNGTGWPLAKSLSLIPESFRFAMVYGINPHTGRRTEPWRLRNVIRWVRPNPPVGALCVDDQTEALTLDGWKRHDQLSDGDLIASYDLKSDSIRFLPATFVRYEREGEPMVVIDKKATSQWFTEHHRCLVKTRKGGVQVRLAQDLTNECETLLCAPFEDVSGPAPVTTTRAALLGWYVAEGSPKYRQARIVQSATANPEKVAAIRQLLEADGADFTESVYRHPYNDSDIVTFTVKGELAEWLNLHHHRLPMMYATTWPEAQAQALFDALIDGDGHRRKNAEGMLFHQQDEATADVVQTLAIRLGWRASKSWQPSMNIWQVTIGRRSRWTAIRKWEGSGIRREVYTGTVWCPQVETGFWLARRNGKTFITGNSDKFRPATSELMVFCKAKDRYFDLDAVREPFANVYDREAAEGLRPAPVWNGNANKSEAAGTNRHQGLQQRKQTQSGAPPLDWWNIPPGGYSGFTTRTVQVPVDLATFDGFSGDIQCITSADCPEHGDQSDPAPTGSHDERGANLPIRNLDIRDRLARARASGSVPTDPPLLPTPEAGNSDLPDPGSTPAATPRSKASRKKAPAPATNSPDTASDRTAGHIADTSTEPLSGAPHPDTPESRTSTPDQPSADPGTPLHTTDKPDQQSACTCSYFVEKSDNTSHYAVWPPELLIKPIKAMCPEKVCRQCGEPRRRIVEQTEGYAVAMAAAAPGRAAKRRDHETGNSYRQTRPELAEYVTLGFSDCGHDDYRPGLILDPFAGSGTTLAVATGHGRDAIGIDLDARNYDLALDRVGPLVLELGDIDTLGTVD